MSLMPSKMQQAVSEARAAGRREAYEEAKKVVGVAAEKERGRVVDEICAWLMGLGREAQMKKHAVYAARNKARFGTEGT